MDNYLVG